MNGANGKALIAHPLGEDIHEAAKANHLHFVVLLGVEQHFTISISVFHLNFSSSALSPVQRRNTEQISLQRASTFALCGRLMTISDQTETAPRKFKLGPLGTLHQVTKGLAKTIRAMADGTLDSQVGARICNGLGIMRACLETQKLEQLEARMDEIADRVARDRTRAAGRHQAQ
jgi:hypothetical protein